MSCRVALGTQIVEQRINSEVQIKVLLKPLNNPLGVSPSKGKQGTTRGRVALGTQLYAAQHSYVPLLSLRRDSPSKIVPDFPCATL